jgi:RNA polymerase sigma-70 factor (ECF subfamily)
MDAQIKRALQNPDAMTEFLRELEPFVYRVCYHLTGHRQDAEDLAQEAIVKVCRNLHTYRGDSALQSWVYRIILNTQRDLIRRQKHMQTVEISETATAADALEGQVSIKLMVQGMLDELSGVDRQIFILRFLQDLSLKEVAALLEMKEATVKTRLFRIRDRLKASVWGAKGGWA